MYFAPLGIFGAIAATVGANGLTVLKSYFKVIGALYVALAVFVLLVLIIACKIVKISFRSLLSALQEPALLAFTTASSEAAFPKAMDIMERFGVPKKLSVLLCLQATLLTLTEVRFIWLWVLYFHPRLSEFILI